MELKYGRFYRARNGIIGMVVGPEGYKEIFNREHYNPDVKYFFIMFTSNFATYAQYISNGKNTYGSNWDLVEELPSYDYDRYTYEVVSKYEHKKTGIDEKAMVVEKIADKDYFPLVLQLASKFGINPSDMKYGELIEIADFLKKNA